MNNAPKNTLQRLDDLEKQVSGLETASSLSSVLREAAPDWKSFSSLRSFSEDTRNALTGFAKNTQDAGQMQIEAINALSRRLMTIEQSLVSFSKTFAGLCSELIENHNLDNSAVMRRVRAMDEEEAKNEIKMRVKFNAIKPCDAISDLSTVVIASKVFDPSSNTETVESEYHPIDLPSNVLPEEDKAKFLGKKVGDIVELDAGDGKILKLTILESYDLITGEREGEVVPESVQPL